VNTAVAARVVVNAIKRLILTHSAGFGFAGPRFFAGSMLNTKPFYHFSNPFLCLYASDVICARCRLEQII
jgi:hypothetical protein